MEINYEKTVKIHELTQFIPVKAGATHSQLLWIFYYTRLFKYISYRHLIQLKKSFAKICTAKNLRTFCELGYLKSPQPSIYYATNKVLPYLKKAGFNTDVLPEQSQGEGDINEINNTDVFVEATKLAHFYTLVYPNFTSLIPDALLVLYDTDNRKYKLIFLEIEASKSKWSEYIDEKISKYKELSKVDVSYTWWKSIAPKLGLIAPDIQNFSFSVAFICSLTKQPQHGITFISKISDLYQVE